MSELPKTREYEAAYDTGAPERRMVEVAYLKLKADAMRDELLDRIAELEAALAERDRLLWLAVRDALWSDDRRTPWEYVTDLRARAEEGSADEIMQDVWERRFQEPGVDLLARIRGMKP